MKRIALLLALSTIVGCASLPGTSRSSSSSGGQATGDDAVQRARIHELQKQAAMAQAEIRLLRRQLAELTIEVERLAAREEPVASSESRSRVPESLSAPLESPSTPPIEQTDLEPVRVQPPAPMEPPPPQVVTSTQGDPSPNEGTVPISPAGQSIYDRGYTLYHQGRYLDAETSFQRFLQGHGGTDLADNAQFWIGESRFARQDYLGASLAFQEVLDRFPDGNKTADALLKVGDCLHRLDDPAGARARFEEVLSRFPGSVAAVMAEERLARQAN